VTDTLYLVCGGQRVALTGAAAEMAALLAEHQAAVGQFPRGAVRLDWGNDGVTLTLLETTLGRRKRESVRPVQAA
jgi:hypothetical protein